MNQQMGVEKSERTDSRAATAVDTVPDVWIPIWERCTSWYPSSDKAAISCSMDRCTVQKVHVDRRIFSVAVFVICCVDENDHRDIIAMGSMAEEYRDACHILFQSQKKCG